MYNYYRKIQKISKSPNVVHPTMLIHHFYNNRKKRFFSHTSNDKYTKDMRGFTITCRGGCKRDLEGFGERMGMHYEEGREREREAGGYIERREGYYDNIHKEFQRANAGNT